MVNEKYDSLEIMVPFVVCGVNICHINYEIIISNVESVVVTSVTQITEQFSPKLMW